MLSSGTCVWVVVSSFRTVTRHYATPSYASTHLTFARRVQELTLPDSLIIVGGFSYQPKGLRRLEPDGLHFGSIANELYQSHRKGWYVHSNYLSGDVIRNLRSKGARYFVTLHPRELGKRPAVRKMLNEEFALLVSSGFLVGEWGSVVVSRDARPRAIPPDSGHRKSLESRASGAAPSRRRSPRLPRTRRASPLAVPPMQRRVRTPRSSARTPLASPRHLSVPHDPARPAAAQRLLRARARASCDCPGPRLPAASPRCLKLSRSRG